MHDKHTPTVQQRTVLEQARDDDQEVRLVGGQVGLERAHARVDHGGAPRERKELGAALEDVPAGEEGQEAVPRGGVPAVRVVQRDVVELVQNVAVRERHALGVARRSRRVNERQQVVRLDVGGAVLRAVLAANGHHVLDRHHGDAQLRGEGRQVHVSALLVLRLRGPEEHDEARAAVCGGGEPAGVPQPLEQGGVLFCVWKFSGNGWVSDRVGYVKHMR